MCPPTSSWVSWPLLPLNIAKKPSLEICRPIVHLYNIVHLITSASITEVLIFVLLCSFDIINLTSDHFSSTRSGHLLIVRAVADPGFTNGGKDEAPQAQMGGMWGGVSPSHLESV